jgi:hypothetical protein
MNNPVESNIFAYDHNLSYACMMPSEYDRELYRLPPTQFLDGQNKELAAKEVGKALVERFYKHVESTPRGEYYKLSVFAFSRDDLEIYKKLLRAEWEAERETTCN